MGWAWLVSTSPSTAIVFALVSSVDWLARRSRRVLFRGVVLWRGSFVLYFIFLVVGVVLGLYCIVECNVE